MQDRLEEFVKENREAFDDKHPGDHLWEGIASSLEKEVEVVPVSRSLWMWKAAVILLLGAVSFLVVERFSIEDEEPALVSSNKEFQELEAFYTAIIAEKNAELTVELEGEEFFNYLKTDIEELDAIYDELKATYTGGVETPNPEVVETLIHLLRQRLHLINSQLDILEEAKSEDGEEEKTSTL